MALVTSCARIRIQAFRSLSYSEICFKGFYAKSNLQSQHYKYYFRDKLVHKNYKKHRWVTLCKKCTFYVPFVVITYFLHLVSTVKISITDICGVN